MKLTAALILTAGLACAACATAPEGASAPADYNAVPNQPPTRTAHLYAACLQQAAAAGAYRVANDGDGAELLLFTCTGVPATNFATALAPWSDRIGSGLQRDGRTFRSTAKVQANLYGVDYCLTDASGGDATCTLSFDAGDFLDDRP